MMSDFDYNARKAEDTKDMILLGSVDHVKGPLIFHQYDVFYSPQYKMYYLPWNGKLRTRDNILKYLKDFSRKEVNMLFDYVKNFREPE